MENQASLAFRAGYVAIVGRPNVGKSTLLNQILNFKVSAVTRRPQTTRHQIRGILNGKDYQVVFLDTPGLLEPRYKLQQAMSNAVQRAVKDADLILIIIDASTGPEHKDLTFLEENLANKRECFVAINKIDLVAKNALLPVIEAFQAYQNLRAIIPISALKSDGLDRLKNEVVAALPTSPPYYSSNQILDHPERFIASELIREKIFQRYGDEIPYSTTVVVEEFKERRGQKDYIQAVIYVERDSQKGILIGKKGSALKTIGRLSREDIESALGRPVFLELWVKVREKWRHDERTLKEFGYYN